MKARTKNILIHVVAIAVMLIVSCIYFAPVLSGDVVVQGDMQKADAMAHAQREAAKSTGTTPNWNPSMFSGMPGYQTAVEPQSSIFTPLKALLILRPFGVERNIGMLWLYLIGFYVAMIAFGCSPWLALLGAVGFGLGSYNIIICEAGHITKGWAMAMIAPILAGMVLCIRATTGARTNSKRSATPASAGSDATKALHCVNWRQVVWGAILFTLALGLQITFNHIQITFYTALGGVVLGFTYAIYALKDKWFAPFLVSVGVLLVGCAFAVGGNYRHLTVNQEYADVTMRGGSEISVTPADLGLETQKQSEATQSGGLDIDYAFSWSYGVGETYTLLVPGAMGGGSGERVAEDSQWAQRTGQRQAPLYWGDQPFTSGPVYFGAIIVFLFLMGCCVVKGPERWWIIIATAIAIVMSWGRHCMPINEFLFNHMPLYNKFRTPSMSLVLANTTMVIMAVLALKNIFERKSEKGDQKTEGLSTTTLNKILYWVGGIMGGIIIIGMVVAKSKLSFTGPGDAQYQQMLGDQWPMFQQMLIEERRGLFMRDSWRSLLFVALTFATLWLYVNDKLKKSGWVVAIIGVLVLFDLWGVDRRYLNKDNFAAPERLALHKNPAEQMLDQTAAANGDADYRVYDLTVNTFNDSRPSAFHNEIGGYSAAKLRRYQDLIDFYLGSQKLYNYVNNMQISMKGNLNGMPLLAVEEPYPVLDMLNARYLMLNLQQNQPTPVQRTTALGNCWLVEEVQMVPDANAEILALNNFDPARTAIVDQSKFSVPEALLRGERDSNESIVLVRENPANPDHLTYRSKTNKERLALFSEIYYAPDWRAYIDGKPAEYIRADYVLRAMVIPAGDHKIEFINEAPTLHRHDTITLIISLLMLAAMACAIFFTREKKGKI